ncbi:hypothetical protein [Azospirillum canadense]|uniref:hypothetical protein n=1 Tax=Azospirillum canadense TaxID=403962 RepID=UPI002226330D|nr:hypothetical protein [Azospirillum canadense]MCW2242079.1 hypothetical protein [Azospirillum canadense]
MQQATNTLPRVKPVWHHTLALGFLAGALSVLSFHQATLGVLHLAEAAAGAPWRLTPTAPFGVPAVLSAAFWGGLWGCVFAMVQRWFPRGVLRGLAASFLFGAIAPTLVGWFVVLPLKGMPVGGGWRMAGMLTGLLVNGAWGVGTAVFLAVLAHVVSVHVRKRFCKNVRT